MLTHADIKKAVDEIHNPPQPPPPTAQDIIMHAAARWHWRKSIGMVNIGPHAVLHSDGVLQVDDIAIKIDIHELLDGLERKLLMFDVGGCHAIAVGGSLSLHHAGPRLDLIDNDPVAVQLLAHEIAMMAGLPAHRRPLPGILPKWEKN